MSPLFSLNWSARWDYPLFSRDQLAPLPPISDWWRWLKSPRITLALHQNKRRTFFCSFLQYETHIIAALSLSLSLSLSSSVLHLVTSVKMSRAGMMPGSWQCVERVVLVNGSAVLCIPPAAARLLPVSGFVCSSVRSTVLLAPSVATVCFVSRNFLIH